MTPKPPISKPSLDSQWTVPLNAELRAGLRDKVRQYSDGTSNILVPKTPATSKRKIITPPGAAGNVPTPPPVCIPVEVDGIEVDPFTDPLVLGVPYTFSAFGVSGTTPYMYQWFFNGTFVGSGATYMRTLVDADIQNKDGSGLGVIFVTVVVSNPCGIDSHGGSFAAQGDPP